MPFTSLPLYFENAAGQVREHPAGYAVVCYHTGRREPGTFAALGTQVGRLLLARKWHRLLSDQRQLSQLTEEEKSWVSEQWVGQQVARPAQLRQAIILATDVFARLSISQIMHVASTSNIAFRSFEYEQAAHTYLTTQ